VDKNGLAVSHINECKVMKYFNKRKKKNEILNGNIDLYATATNTLYKNYNSSK
jgi:hypothetical protein